MDTRLTPRATAQKQVRAVDIARGISVPDSESSSCSAKDCFIFVDDKTVWFYQRYELFSDYLQFFQGVGAVDDVVMTMMHHNVQCFSDFSIFPNELIVAAHTYLPKVSSQ
jgi:hypothetical protein